MASVRKLVLGSREVTVEFERKRVRNINVRVRRDGTLYCSLPYYASVREAEAFIISKQDYLRFLNIARGSKNEVETQLQICLMLDYLKPEEAAEAQALCAEVGKMLNALIHSIDNS